MFGSKDQEGTTNLNQGGNQTEDTVIGSTIKIEGDLVSNGNIIVDGEVVGSLKTEKSLTIGAGAKVSADIKANQASIAGEVNGNIEIMGRIDLSESAKVHGDIKASVLAIQAGAKFNGQCSMEEGVAVTSKAQVSESEDEVEAEE